MQKTLVMIKPDATPRRLIGKIISRFEEKGLEIIGLKMNVISEEQARENYSVHEGRDYCEKLIDYITAGPVVFMVLRGKNAIDVTRMLMGSTFGHEAAPGTIRGDYAISKRLTCYTVQTQPSPQKKKLLFSLRMKKLSNTIKQT